MRQLEIYRPGKFSNEPEFPIVRDISTLLITPGTRLVMPSEQTEDFTTGLGYVGEFDRFRAADSSKEDQSHTEFLTTYASVFANDAAAPYMKNEKLRFPVGAMIVREKLNKPADEIPEMLSAMIKRERGFNPLTNDWDFILVDKATSKVSTGRSTQSCAVCHATMRSSDFLFKTYLP